MLEKGDYSSLYEHPTATKVLCYLADHIHIYNGDIVQKCKYTLDLIEFRIGTMSYSQLIYQELLAAAEHLSLQMGYYPQKSNAKTDEGYTDRLYSFYIQEM